MQLQDLKRGSMIAVVRVVACIHKVPVSNISRQTDYTE